MRYSAAFLPTLRETPKEATTVSHALLLRAGYIRMVGAGLYEFLPLGVRVLQRIATIIREEMDRAGAQEVLMPAVLPSEYFKETGRWDKFGPTLFRLHDRKHGEYHLAPTHEEIITDMVRREIKSYRQLPINLYQIQMKYRDEPRPRAGLLRCREFLMKDAYSFDVSPEAARKSYDAMEAAYHRVFGRLGLQYRLVAADSGAMGGSGSAEFQVLAQSGEDAIAACTACDYAANVEVATAAEAAAASTPSGELPAPVRVHTPGAKTIEQLVAFFGDRVEGVGADRFLKSVVYLAGDEQVLAVVRGDHEVNEIKLARAVGADEVHWVAEPEHAGFLGPVGWKDKVVVDAAAAAVADGITGANEEDHHLQHVRHGRDFEGTVADIRLVAKGDPCPRCGGALELYRGIEAGHIFMLGTHYTDAMKAEFLDAEGTSRPIVMGCYGIGVSRLVAAVVEQLHDDDGLVWPSEVAPYAVIVTPLGGDEPTAVAEDLYAKLRERGLTVMLDDRDERPGVKLKDAELLGIPLSVRVGKRGLKDGNIEIKARRSGETSFVPLAGAVDAIADLVAKS
ncbi:proline--tRNA ligase [Paraliomyxa miuraensis]|uniref:proline--tRNA ligase n=1 Tax=Paraliomyxa miuraensis TaxID=376150 RepID=UPI00224EDF23|nr:proline--tRNA ligase [Paraliomyxa miuraensis]MCX4242889.1 proline--tRNA ligase [Paraliomyxa miuraensis]